MRISIILTALLLSLFPINSFGQITNSFTISKTNIYYHAVDTLISKVLHKENKVKIVITCDDYILDRLPNKFADIDVIKTNKFEINYQPMIDDFEYIKKVIKNKNNTGYHSEYIEKLMFNFKSKWDIRVGKMATKIYFEDLCAVFYSVEILVGC